MLLLVTISLSILIFVLILHYCQHFRLECGCGPRRKTSIYGSKSLPTSTPDTATTTSSGRNDIDHINESGTNLLNHRESGTPNTRCCQLLSVDGEDFDFFPISFLFYVIYVILLCLLVIVIGILNFLQHKDDKTTIDLLFGVNFKSFEMKSIMVHSLDDIHQVFVIDLMDYILIYGIMILSVWEGLFSFYRYYTTVVATTTFQETSTLTIMARYSVYAILFCTLFIIEIHLYYWIFPLIIILSVSFNCYCTYKFASLLIDRYKAFIAMDEDFQTDTNKEILSSVIFMKYTSLTSCVIQSIYLSVFIITYNADIIYYLPMLWSISCFIFTVNFVRNRQVLQHGLFKLKQRCIQISKPPKMNCCLKLKMHLKKKQSKLTIRAMSVVSNSVVDRTSSHKGTMDDMADMDTCTPNVDPISPEIYTNKQLQQHMHDLEMEKQNDIFNPDNISDDEDEQNTPNTDDDNDNGNDNDHSMVIHQATLGQSQSDNIHNHSQRAANRKQLNNNYNGHVVAATMYHGIQLEHVIESEAKHTSSQNVPTFTNFMSDPIKEAYQKMEHGPKFKQTSHSNSNSKQRQRNKTPRMKDRKSSPKKVAFKLPQQQKDMSTPMTMTEFDYPYPSHSNTSIQSNQSVIFNPQESPRKNKAKELLGISSTASPSSNGSRKSSPRKGSPRRISPRKTGSRPSRNNTPRTDCISTPKDSSPRKQSPRKKPGSARNGSRNNSRASSRNNSPRKNSPRKKGKQHLPGMRKEKSYTLTISNRIHEMMKGKSTEKSNTKTMTYNRFNDDHDDGLRGTEYSSASDDDDETLQERPGFARDISARYNHSGLGLPRWGAGNGAMNKSARPYKPGDHIDIIPENARHIAQNRQKEKAVVIEMDLPHAEDEDVGDHVVDYQFQDGDDEEGSMDAATINHTRPTLEGSHWKSNTEPLEAQKVKDEIKLLNAEEMMKSLNILAKYGFCSRRSVNSVQQLAHFNLKDNKAYHEKMEAERKMKEALEKRTNGHKNSTGKFGKYASAF